MKNHGNNLMIMFNLALTAILFTSLISPFSINPNSDNDATSSMCENLPIVTYPEPPTQSQPTSTEIPTNLEALSKRTENTKFYTDPDGLTTAEVFMQPVHYLDDNGLWQDFDTQLIPCAPEDEYIYKNERNGMKTFFSDISSGSIVKVERNGYYLTWTPLGMEPVSEPTVKADGNRIEYHCTLKRITSPTSVIEDEYIVLPNKLKHNVVLPDQISIDSADGTDSNTFSISGNLNYPASLKLSAGDLRSNSGFTTGSSLEFRDNKNNVIFQLPAPYAYELNDPSVRVECYYQVELPVDNNLVNGNFIKLSIHTPCSWLSSPSRTYPVVIDPTITLPKYSDDGFDTFIEKGNHTAGYDVNNSNFGQDPILKLTRDDPDKVFVSRILAKFDVSGIDPIAEIKNASLKLRLNSGDDLVVVSAFRITHSWLEGTGRISKPEDDGATWKSFDGNQSHVWSDGGDRASKIYDTIDVGISSKDYYWEITELVQGWVDQDYSNYGVMLVGNDGDMFVEKEFSSSEGGNFPRLVVQYNTPPTLNPVFSGYKHKINEDHPVHYLDLNYYFYDPDSDDNLNFKIHSGTSWTNPNRIYEGEYVKVTVENNETLKFETRSHKFGTEKIKLNATDKHNSKVVQELTIIVNSINDAPKIVEVDGMQIPSGFIDIEAQEDHSKKITINTTDMDFTFAGDTLTYSYTANKDYILAFGSVWDKNDKLGYQWTSLVFRPTNADVGEAFVNITVTDSTGANHTVKTRITVANSNDKPINPSIVCLKDGKPCIDLEFITSDTIRFEGNADDPDLYIPDSTEKLRYEWSSDIQGEIGTTKNLETKLQKGYHEITFKITDSENEFTKTSIMVNVKNIASIDTKNCTCAHADIADDVISYSYRQYTENGTYSFEVEKGKFKNIDIVALGSQRDEDDLIIYLTVDGIIVNTTNYEYEIYLVKSFHMEEPHTVQDKYNLKIYEDHFYVPENFEYYAKFTLDDGEISEEDDSTIIVIAELGDLEAGEGTNQPLEAEFEIFAIAKYNNHDPKGDPLKHDMAYDSAGHGNATAPILTKEEEPESIAEAVVDNLVYIMLIVIIIIIIVAVIGIRMKKSKETPEQDSASADGVIYDTSGIEIQSPDQLAYQAPPSSTGMTPAQAQQLQPIAPPPEMMGGVQPRPYPVQQPVPVQPQPQPAPVPVQQEGPVVQLPDQQQQVEVQSPQQQRIRRY